MVEYPKVKQKLPELFELIIACDKLTGILKPLNVVSFEDWKENKLRREELTRAAQRFITKAKGPQGGFG